MYQDDLTKKIARAGDEGWTTLDLSKSGLDYLPREIGNLTALTGLDLRRNQLTTLPPELGNLTGLTELNLSNNQLKGVLPPELGNLTSLTMLDLSINFQASFPPEILELWNRGVIKNAIGRFKE